MTLTARNEQIVRDIMRGESIGVLAEDHDLSPKTIWAIFKRTTGLTISEARGYRVNCNARPDVSESVVAMLTDQGMSREQIARKLGTTVTTIGNRRKAIRTKRDAG